MKLQNEIEISFNLIAQRALSAHLTAAAHDETKEGLQYLRECLKDYIELKSENKPGTPDLPTPP